MKKELVLVFSFFVVFITQAQQDAQYTNYMYNTMNINPAYAGSRGTTSLFGIHRSQWIGLEGAPTTNMFAIHSPIYDSNVGLGLTIMNDVIGPSNENTISVDYSYTIPTSDRFKLAFGLRATAHLISVDFTRLNIFNSGDVLAQDNIVNRFSPNFGVGLYWYSDRTYLGLSIPNLLETSHFDRWQNDMGAASVAKEIMHYHLIGGHVFDLNYAVQFKPAFLLKVVEGAPLQLDLSANFLFYEKFALGLAYRWDAAMSALAAFQVSQNWMIGFAYDMEVTKLSYYNSGSPEFFLRYEFGRNKRVVSPRFF